MSHPNPSQIYADRMDTVIDLLCRVIAAKASRYWVWAPTVLVLWSYFRRVSLRFRRLLARIDAGIAPRTRPPAQPRAADGHARPPRPPRPSLPRHFAWLCQLGPEIVGCGTQLKALLSDPDLAALLAASPQAGRLLRPILNMLGQTADLPAPAKRPRATPPPPDISPTPGVAGCDPAGPPALLRKAD